MLAPPGVRARLLAEAAARGFALSGVAPATPADADGFARYQHWLDRGFAGDMTYLHDHAAARRHPSSILPGVRSVVMLGLEYGVGARGEGQGASSEGARGEGRVAKAKVEDVGHLDSASLLAPCPLPLAPTARVAAYARGPDYHRYIWDRVNELSAWLEAEVPGCAAHGVTDTAPLLERDFARRAGLGWVGKNAMLISPTRGSYFFLAALLTTAEFEPDPPFAADHCGTCTACLDACPTQAFAEPGVVDARKCVSYLTIESRSPIPVELRPEVGNWVWGCDVCQEVCPWNRKPTPTAGAFPADPGLASLDPVELLGLSSGAFRARFKHTALWRNRRAGLLRNAAVVLGNVGDARAVPALEKAARDDPSELVREAAGWALARVRERAGDEPLATRLNTT